MYLLYIKWLIHDMPIIIKCVLYTVAALASKFWVKWGQDKF